MGESMPVYPAAMSTLAQTTTGPARWHATRVTAAFLSFCALVLVLVGLFLPLYSGTLSVGTQDIEVTISPWSADVEGPSAPGDVPRIGYPLVFAAIVLACAAALNWYAATPAAGPGAGRASATTTAVGGAFLVGIVWTTALTVVNAVDNVVLLGSMAPGLETEASYLVGHWLLLVAALLGFGAAVLSLIPVRRPTWGQANPEVATPPYGIAVVPVQQPRPPQPFQVDPLTGHPLPPSPPSGVPVVHPWQPYAQPPPPQAPLAEPPVAQPPGAVPPAEEPPQPQPPQASLAEPPAAAPPPAAQPPAAVPPVAEPPQPQAPLAEPPPAQSPGAVPPAEGPPQPRPPQASLAEPPAAEPPAAVPPAAQSPGVVPPAAEPPQPQSP